MDNGETVQLKTSSLHPPCALEEMQQLPGIWSRFYCPTFRGNDQKEVAKVYDQCNSDLPVFTQNLITLSGNFNQANYGVESLKLSINIQKFNEIDTSKKFGQLIKSDDGIISN